MSALKQKNADMFVYLFYYVDDSFVVVCVVLYLLYSACVMLMCYAISIPHRTVSQFICQYLVACLIMTAFHLLHVEALISGSC